MWLVKMSRMTCDYLKVFVVSLNVYVINTKRVIKLIANAVEVFAK